MENEGKSMQENNETMKAVYIVVNAGFGAEAVELIRECGSGGATIINARGTGHHFQSFLGGNFEPEKEIIISLVTSSVAEKIMQTIADKKGAKTPANGVCFSLPVDKMTLINKQEPIKP